MEGLLSTGLPRLVFTMAPGVSRTFQIIFNRILRYFYTFCNEKCNEILQTKKKQKKHSCARNGLIYVLKMKEMDEN